jgi:SAM-dependent methyltransferase
MDVTEHDKKYWRYEYDVVANYLIPLLRRWGVQIEEARLLDVGCAYSGGICAMHDAGMVCRGFDFDERFVAIANGLRGNRKFHIVLADIHEDPAPYAGETFDLVVLHDVFEHLEKKHLALQRLKSYLSQAGEILITFPPYYSAFGAHQQVLNSKFARLPYFHLLPFALTAILPRLMDEHRPFIEEVQRLGKMKMGLAKFERLVDEAGLHVAHRKHYLIGPNHIRFGLKPVGAGILGRIPGIRELLTTGAIYLIAREGALSE